MSGYATLDLCNVALEACCGAVSAGQLPAKYRWFTRVRVCAIVFLLEGREGGGFFLQAMFDRLHARSTVIGEDRVLEAARKGKWCVRLMGAVACLCVLGEHASYLHDFKWDARSVNASS